MIRVLLADDEALVRSGVAMIISGVQDVELVASVSDSVAAVTETRRLRPDVALLDIRMPGGGGIAAAAQIITDSAEHDHRIGVLMVTTFGDHDSVQEALRVGASGYLVKNDAASQLVPAIRAVAGGAGWLDPLVTLGVIKQAVSLPPQVSPARLHQLTLREREILGLLADGLPNRKIATRLGIGSGTVKSHVSHLFAKLGLENRSQAVAAAYRAGLR